MQDRIKQFLVAQSISPSHFADSIGIQRSGMSHILSGRNKPSLDFVEKMIKQYPEINIDWLVMGKGSMFKEPIQKSLFSDTKTKTEPVPVSQGNLFDNVIENQENVKSDNMGNKVVTNVNSSITNKQIHKLIVIYNDKTFDEYLPNNL
jgi:hypothetical protein